MNTAAIEARAITKTYDQGDSEAIVALAGIDLLIAKGEIYALLGPNGAGKTSTISILTTLLPPTTGNARVAGFDVVNEAGEVRRRIGVTFQEMVLDQELTGREILDFHGRLYGQSKSVRQARIEELAQMVELESAIDRKVAGYSGGMKRRLELIRGLMTRPEVLFLDEPTQGLDPQNRAGIWAYIQRLRKETGLTLLLTTHYMEEAEALSDRVGIIDHGQLVIEGEPNQLISQMGADVVTACGHGATKTFAERLRREPYVSRIVQHAGPPDTGNGSHTEVDGHEPVASQDWCMQIGVDNGDERLLNVVGLAAGTGITLSKVSVSHPTLADVFLAHTGREFRDV